MLRPRIWLVCLTLAACKAPSSALEAADARGGRFDRLEEGTYLLCDCGALIPFAERPAFPRAHPIAGGARCAFNPAGAQAPTATLVADVRKAGDGKRFERVVAEIAAAHVKGASVTRGRTAAGDVVLARGARSDGEDAGTDVVAVVRLEAARLVLSVEDHGGRGSEPDEGAFSAYLAAAAANAGRACL